MRSRAAGKRSNAGKPLNAIANIHSRRFILCGVGRQRDSVRVTLGASRNQGDALIRSIVPIVVGEFDAPRARDRLTVPAATEVEQS